MENNNSLIDFNWEEDDFSFGDEVETKNSNKDTENKNIENNENTNDVSDNVNNKKEGEESNIFNFEDEVTGFKDSNDTSSPSSVYTDVFLDFKKQGFFKHVDLEEGEDIDQDKFYKLQEQEYEQEIESRINAWATLELDEDAKAFINFKRKGGSTQDFFNTYKGFTPIEEGDISDEDFQDKVIRLQLKEEGWDKDEIEDRLEYLTDTGKKSKIAEKYFEKIKKNEVDRKLKLEKDLKLKQEKANEEEKEYFESIKYSLENVKDIKGFKISEREKSDLYDFITKKSIRIKDKKSITELQKSLAEVFKDTEKTILLAKLLKTDFDMSSYEKDVVTKKVKQIKSNLEQRRSLRPSNSGSSFKGSSLSDLFE